MQTQGGRASLTKSGSGTTQNAPNTRAPSGDLQQRQHTEGPRQSAGAVQASLSGQPVRPAPPAPNAPPPAVARAQPAVSQASRGKQPQGTQSAGEAAIRKRAEERAKVPLKFRDSFKDFFFLPTGVLKILRLGLIIGALACFITAKTHELYIAITVLEICIVLFFIITYMLTLHHLLICLDWSLLDLINSFITAVFLLIVAILAMQEMERRHLFYAGGI
ncbi:CKLF-like MARVEL transmembrane domain-containing protein 2B [Crocuta crocuta]